MGDPTKDAPDSKGAELKTVSERKRNANRQNALRSTGPRSAAGKRRSRWNALKHGLLAKEVDSNYGPYFKESLDIQKEFRFRDPLESLMKALVDHLDPVGPVEGMLVELIARCYWRQRRIQQAENAKVRLAMVDQFFRIQMPAAASPKERDALDVQKTICKEARQSIDTLGYVEAHLQKRALDGPFTDQDREEFVAANERAQELVRNAEFSQGSPNLDIPLKRARSKLMRQLDVLEHWLQILRDSAEYNQNRDRDAKYAQHLVLDDQSMDNFLRYETANQRQLYRALAELERLQQLRGDSVAPARKLSM